MEKRTLQLVLLRYCMHTYSPSQETPAQSVFLLNMATITGTDPRTTWQNKEKDARKGI
jgi:hypothetical protein